MLLPWLVLVVGLAIVHARHMVEHMNGFTFGDETESDFQDDFAAPSNHAKVARDLVHRANWTSFGTVSSIDTITGFPMVSVSSVADSQLGAQSTGRIYFYVAKESMKYKDLVRSNKATLLYSEAHDASCQKRGVDPMEPTCMRTMLSGQVYRLKNGTDEFNFGRSAYVSRHPAAHDWLEVHGMVLCRLQIENILVIDFYGGAKNVSVDEYYRYDSVPFEVEQVVHQAHPNRIIENAMVTSPPQNHAEVARELVHHADWASFGTISTVKNIRGFPMVSMSSVADSASDAKSTGNIYFFVAKESLKFKDLLAQNKATLLFTDAQNKGCESRGVDPMEPTCMRTTITGHVIELQNGTAEFEIGHAAFVSRHPVARNWLEVHAMVLCKLEIQEIFVIDFYGGAKNVSVKDYYNIPPAFMQNHDNDVDRHQLASSSANVPEFEPINHKGINNAAHEVDSNETADRVHIRIHKSRAGEQVIDIFV